MPNVSKLVEEGLKKREDVVFVRSIPENHLPDFENGWGQFFTIIIAPTRDDLTDEELQALLESLKSCAQAPSSMLRYDRSSIVGRLHFDENIGSSTITNILTDPDAIISVWKKLLGR